MAYRRIHGLYLIISKSTKQLLKDHIIILRVINLYFNFVLGAFQYFRLSTGHIKNTQ